MPQRKPNREPLRGTNFQARKPGANVRPGLKPPGGPARNVAQAIGQTKGTGVPAALRQKFGENWREKAYGNIEGYKKGLGQRVKAARAASTANPADSAAQAKFARLNSTLAAVRARRAELGVGKSANQPTTTPSPTGAPTPTTSASPTTQPTRTPPMGRPPGKPGQGRGRQNAPGQLAVGGFKPYRGGRPKNKR